MTANPMPIWIIAPSAELEPDAQPVFPLRNAERVGMRPNAGVEPVSDKGWVDLPGDTFDDSSDMLAIERRSAIGFFHRMGMGLRVAYGMGAQNGHFPNGLRDPATIAKGLATKDTGFAVRLDQLEPAVGRWMRWLAPDVTRNKEREADYLVAKRLLALLREAKHVGGVAVLFIPTEVESPHVVPN